MALFKLGKKKETITSTCNCCSSEKETNSHTTSCSCGSSCCEDNDKKDNNRFIVLGACCKKSSDTFENTKIAVKEMGFNEEVLNIGDNLEIAKYGVMQTPALIIDNKVVSYGKLLKVEDVKKLIESNLK